MNTIEAQFSICSHYLSAIVNGDYSGLSHDECLQLDSFLDSVIAECGVGHWDIGEDDPSFQEDEVSGLMADCIDCIYVVFP